MKKRTVLLAIAVVFGLGAFVGFRSTPAQAGLCYWKWLQCTQGYDC